MAESIFKRPDEPETAAQRVQRRGGFGGVQSPTPVTSTLQPVEVGAMVAQGGPGGNQGRPPAIPTASVGVIEPFGSGSDVSLGRPAIDGPVAPAGGGLGGGGGGGAGGLLATINALQAEGKAEIAASLEQNLGAISQARQQYGDAILQSEAVRSSNLAQVLGGLDETATGRAADLEAQGVTGGAGQAAFDSVRAVIEGMGVSQQQLSSRFAEIQESIFQDFELEANAISQDAQNTLSMVSMQAQMAARGGGGGGRGGGGGAAQSMFDSQQLAYEAFLAQGFPPEQALLMVSGAVNAGIKTETFKQGTAVAEEAGVDPLTFGLESGLVGIGEGGFTFTEPDGTVVPISSSAAQAVSQAGLTSAESAAASDAVFRARQEQMLRGGARQRGF